MLGSLNPRKLSPASIMMLVAILAVMSTIIRCRTFGKMWLEIIRRLLAPKHLAAVTNSNSLSLINSARIALESPAHPIIPKTKITIPKPKPATRTVKATLRKTIKKRKEGITKNISLNRIKIVSIIPP